MTDPTEDELELQDKTEITLHYDDPSQITVEYTDIFGNEHTLKSNHLQKIFDELEIRLRIDQLADDSFVPLSEVDNETSLTHARIRDNYEERFRKALEFLQAHPATVSVQGSEPAKEIWAESVLARDPPEFETLERKFGLERFGSFIRYNDDEEKLVKEITWDVKELILEIGEPEYDQLIADLDDELPDYAETIDGLKSDNTSE